MNKLRQGISSENRLDGGFRPSYRSSLLLVLTILTTCSPIISLDAWPTDELKLSLTHPRVDIDILDLDVKWTLLRMFEPRPALPAKVQNKEEGTCKIILEEDGGVKIGPTDRPESDVELGSEAEEVHQGASIRTPDTECGSKWQFIDVVALMFPVKSKLVDGSDNPKMEGYLPCGTEANVGYSNAAEYEERRETR